MAWKVFSWECLIVLLCLFALGFLLVRFVDLVVFISDEDSEDLED